MSEMRKRYSRPRIGIRRWWEVFVVAAVCAVATVFLLWWKPDTLVRLDAVPRVIWLSIGALLLVLGIRYGARHLGALVGIRYAWIYPPLWIGAFVGVAVALLAVNDIESVREGLDIQPSASMKSGAWILLGAAVVILVFSLIILGIGLVSALTTKFKSWWRRRKTQSPSSPSSNADETGDTRVLDIDVLRDWIRSDDPVETVDRDMFDHARIARRLAERLALERPPSQAVIGPLGTGKTTLGNLLAEELRTRSPGIELVRVELWPYETPRAAVMGVISSLVEALSKRINVFGLKGLPTEYANLVAAVAGPVPGALARFKRPQSSPLATLAVIDRVSTVIGRHFVLWVEDLERFAIGNPAQPTPESHDEAERLAPIRALLCGLDRLQSVTVITATTSLYQRFDLEKISRYVERIPSLQPNEVRRIVRIFRASWQGQDVIDPTGENTRSGLGWDSEDDPVLRAMLGGRPRTLADACIALCQTPRTLKQALRRCDEIYSKLPGELDYDATLAMSIVRETTPTGFAIVEQHIDSIRYFKLNRRDGAADPIQNMRTKLSEAGLSGRSVEAIMLIIEKTVIEPGLLQGFAHDSPTDYWHRFLAIPDLLPEERDQDVLVVIDIGDDEKLLEFLTSEFRSQTVAYFAARLTVERRIRLLVPLVERIADENPRQWAEGRRPPGLIPLWQMLLERARQGTLPSELLFDAVLEAYRFTVPRNLTLAAELENWFVIPHQNVPPLLSEESSATAKGHLRELVKQRYTGEPELLAGQFENAVPYILLWLCWGLDRVRSGDLNSPPFEGWPELAETILQAAESRPVALLPQLAPIITKANQPFFDKTSWEFLPDRCAALFGDVSRVLDLFLEVPAELSTNEALTELQRVAQARLADARNDGWGRALETTRYCSA